MKRYLALLLAAMMLFTLSACSAKQETAPEKKPQTAEEPKPAEKLDIRVAALKGPTSLGMLELMDNAKNGKTTNNYAFTLAGAPDELTGSIIKGDFDIAAVPTNLAAVLYNKTQGKVQLAALNTLGVLYLVENGTSIQSIADLKGKTVYATGKGSTPEFALNYILEKNGLKVGTDVQVEYKTEHTELAALLASGGAQIALLPQPFVTSVLMQNQNARVALDLTEEWDKVSDGSQLAMGCVIVQKAFADAHPEALKAFLKEYKASVAYVTDEKNLADAAALAESFEIIKAPVAQKAIPECNIVYMDGSEMKQAVEGFYKVLFAADPTSVGGSLPDEAFYLK
ncbi:ABC transporter substrate-binding protein [Acidaminobacterium chupaoyuni]